MQKVKQTNRCGFTLIELVIVVMILAIVAGIVVPMIGGLSQISISEGISKSDKQIITETSMRAIRDAIMGTETKPGAWHDFGQRPALFPDRLIELLEDENAIGDFNPVTKIGWRGPYVQGEFRQAGADPVFLDGWGKPLEIFVPDTNSNSVMDREDIKYARLVSTGEDGELQTGIIDDFDLPPIDANTENYIPGGPDEETSLSLNECGDDLVMFFFVADTRQ